MATEEKGNLPPFEDRAAYGGFFPALWQTWVRACFHPTKFFETVGNSTNLYPALLFGVLLGWIGLIMNSFWFRLLSFMEALGNLQPPQDVYYTIISEIGIMCANFLFGWSIILIFIYVRGIILHLFLWIFVGAKQDLKVTLRVVSYTQAAGIFTALPCIGLYVAWIYMIVLEIIGLAAAHRTEKWRTALAVLLPTLCSVLLVGAYMYFTQPRVPEPSIPPIPPTYESP